jgi:coronin-7
VIATGPKLSLTQSALFLQSYREFHSDLYPDTASGEPALTADQWFSGQDAVQPTTALQPGKNLIRKERRGALLGIQSQSGNGGVKNDGDATLKPSTPSKAERAVCIEFEFHI